jgi:Fanconi anemia group M protein
MFNYYRWFPKGKIIFMAPTKPLVAQQIKACYEITGIPKNDTEEMTGKYCCYIIGIFSVSLVSNNYINLIVLFLQFFTGMTNAERRTTSWKQKRVFFATPQVVANDLVAQICPADTVRCLVVDEAHRAQGNYAYCQVINTLRAYTSEFRVLALSATPGSDMNAVKQVSYFINL